MTRPELNKLNQILDRIERLSAETDDSVAQAELLAGHRTLINLYHSAKRDCRATEVA